MTTWSLDTAPDFHVEWPVKLRCNSCGYLVIGQDFARPCPEHGVPDLTKGVRRGRVTCAP